MSVLLSYQTHQEGSVDYLAPQDAEAIHRCHDTYAAGQHGWCTLSDFELDGLVKRFCDNRQAVGYWKGGELKGFVTFRFERANEQSFVSNNLIITHWIYNSTPALMALCGFLYRQADQFEHVIYNTQESDFHHLLSDVRTDTGNMLLHAVAHESNLAGVGLMYGIVSMADFLVNTRGYWEADIDIVFHVDDTFCPENAGQYNLSVRGGCPQLVGRPLEGVSVHGNIADLSAVLRGSVDLHLLHRFGKVGVDREGLDPLARVLRTRQKPMCIAEF